MSERVVLPGWPAPANIVAGTTTRYADADVLPDKPHFPKQIHGADVVSAAELRATDAQINADAVIGTEAGDLCVVRTADCVPLLLCARNGSEVAAVHGGWRGIAAGVIEATLAALSTAPCNLIAWLGPAISQPAFEVGADVYDAFVDNDPATRRCFEPNPRGRWQADLYGLARLHLNRAGLSDIYGGKFCTFGDAERFYSFRRNPDCGRMLSFVGIGPTVPTSSARRSRPS